jgi:hypothetical protein
LERSPKISFGEADESMSHRAETLEKPSLGETQKLLDGVHTEFFECSTNRGFQMKPAK